MQTQNLEDELNHTGNRGQQRKSAWAPKVFSHSFYAQAFQKNLKN